MKINVGCGWEVREGWLNVDNTQKPQAKNYPITFMDATATWPHEDDTFEYVLSEHMIEHVPEAKGLNMLKEAYRCLKPGGVARVTCPDKKFAEEIRGQDYHPFVKSYCRKIFNREARLGDANKISNRTLFEQGHVWVPTADMLIKQLEKAGFKNVKQVEYGKSEHEVFDGIEMMDGVRNWETLCVEGTK
jgi:predicted SAM-dependent methyltransferase